MSANNRKPELKVFKQMSDIFLTQQVGSPGLVLRLQTVLKHPGSGFPLPYHVGSWSHGQRMDAVSSGITSKFKVEKRGLRGKGRTSYNPPLPLGDSFLFIELVVSFS